MTRSRLDDCGRARDPLGEHRDDLIEVAVPLGPPIELKLGLLRDLAAHLDGVRPPPPSQTRTLFAEDTNAALLDCALQLMRLLDRPEAIPLLHEGVLRELHYWLLSGPHGDALRALADPTSHASRLGAAIAILRSESVSQFTRDYRRLYVAPPKRDVLRLRGSSRRDVAPRATEVVAARRE